MRWRNPLLLGVFIPLGISWLLWGGLLRMPIPAPVPSTAWERQFGCDITPATNRLLDRRLLTPVVYDTTLDRVIDDLRSTSGAQIFVDWQALEAAGIRKNTPISVDVSGLAFGTAISKIAAAASTAKSKAGCFVKNDLITITTEADAPRGPMFTLLYDVRDFVDVQPENSNSFFTEVFIPRLAWYPPEHLIGRIKALSPDSWVDDSGRGSLRYYNTRLIITQTQPHHRDIACLLHQIRRQRQLWAFAKRCSILTGISLPSVLLLYAGFHHLRSRARRRARRCTTCGYDLRLRPARQHRPLPGMWDRDSDKARSPPSRCRCLTCFERSPTNLHESARISCSLDSCSFVQIRGLFRLHSAQDFCSTAEPGA